MNHFSSTASCAALLLMATGALCGACSDSDQELGHISEDGGADDSGSASLPEAGGGASIPDAGAFSGEVTCKVTPCVTALAAKGGSHICALLADKTVRCWGNNSSGQLGAETPGDDASVPADAGDAGAAGPYSGKPVRVANVENAVQISVAGSSGGTSCARSDDGSVWCWGSNSDGQLGLDAEQAVADAVPHPTASRVQGLPAATRVDLGSGFGCAVGTLGLDGFDGGSMYCWGENAALQLGRGHLPKQHGVVGPVSLRFRRVVAGAGAMRVAFAIRDNGQALSWGSASWDARGIGGVLNRDPLGRESPISPDGDPLEIPGLENVTSLVAGDEHACALAGGDVYCWGVNKTGAVGNSSREDVFAPYHVTVLGAGRLETVAASNTTTCVTNWEGKAYCWGDNTSGQLGGGDAAVVFEPVQVRNLSARVVQLAPMDQTTCALLEDGSVTCWGSNARGQLGIGSRDDLPHYEPHSVTF